MSELIQPQLQASFEAMVPLQNLQARILSFDGREMKVAAPLAPSLNDKGTAFGGTMTSLMTIAGWLLVSHKLSADGRVPEVYITESSAHFSRVVKSDMLASSWLAANSFETVASQLQKRGKVRVRTEARLEGADGTVGAVMTAVFAAVMR